MNNENKNATTAYKDMSGHEKVQVVVNETVNDKSTLSAMSDLVQGSNNDKSGTSEECLSGDIIPVPILETLVETHDALVLDDSITTTNIPATDDRKFLIVTPNGNATIGVGNLESLPDAKGEDGQPAMKRYRMQGEDGQTYILTLTADEQEDHTAKEHQYQSKQPPPVTLPRKFKSTKSSEVGKKNVLLGSEVSQAWFTTRDDKNTLQNSGATWKQGQWTKEEVDILQENIAGYCSEHGINDPTEIIFEMSKDDRKHFYRIIARGLQRPLFSVYRRVTRMYDQKNHMGRYTHEEMVKLRELRTVLGSDWAAIGQALGRSGSSVKDKCRLMKETCNSGKWLPEEESRLTRAVYELAGCRQGEDVVHGLSWAQVAERVSTRSEKQCRTKWLNYMNWKQKGGVEWTRIDDMNLIVRVSVQGVDDDSEINWDELAKGFKSARSPQWLRGKWWSLKRHVPDYQLIPFKELLENMKVMYLQNVRMKSSIGTARTRKIESNVNDNSMTLNLQNLVEGDSLSNDDSSLTGVQFEVLQQIPSSQASLIIAQTSDGEQQLATSLSDHIIVQTVPIQATDADLGLQSRVLIQVPTSSDLGDTGVTSLEHSEIGTAIELAGSIDHSPQVLGTLTEENVISQSSTLAEETSFSRKTLEEVIASSDEAGIVLKPESFQPSTSNGKLMTTFSDPMLNSDCTSLMGTVNDVDADKSHADDIIVKLE